MQALMIGARIYRQTTLEKVLEKRTPKDIQIEFNVIRGLWLVSSYRLGFRTVPFLCGTRWGPCMPRGGVEGCVCVCGLSLRGSLFMV